MNLQSSRHFSGIFKNRQKRFCSRDGLCVTRGVVGWYPGGLPVGVIRDTWSNRSMPEGSTRETRVALGGFQGISFAKLAAHSEASRGVLSAWVLETCGILARH